MQHMVLACFGGNAGAAGRWLKLAIDRGWRGQDIEFAADPAEEPACAAFVGHPAVAAGRTRLLAIVAAETPQVAVATRRAIAYLQKNPPILPPANAG